MNGVCTLWTAHVTPLSGQTWSFVVSLEAPSRSLSLGVARDRE